MGRKVQKKYGQPQQDIITTPLLEGTDGVRKMSKSYNNYIGLDEEPSIMYGKIMSLPDGIMWKYFNLLTDIPLKEIEEMKEKKQKLLLSPRDIKARLAREIVTVYHGEKKAITAEKEFNKVFAEKKLPSKIPIFKTLKRVYPILDLLFDSKQVASKNEAKRVILQKGVKINNVLKTDWKEKISLKDNMVIKVGKRKFVKVKLK